MKSTKIICLTLTLILLLAFFIPTVSAQSIFGENYGPDGVGGPSPGGSGGSGGGGNAGGTDSGAGSNPGGSANPGGESDEGNTGDEGGSGEASSYEPSPEDIARAESMALNAAAESMGIDVSQFTAYQMEQILNEARESLIAANDEANSKEKSDFTGDPVLVTTGKFLLEAADYDIPGNSINIMRRYISEEKTIGSMGAGWLVSLDSRIIRGYSVVDEEILSNIQNLVDRILNNYQRINKNYTASAAIANRLYRNVYLPAKANLDNLIEIKERGQQLAALNQFSMFRGSPESYEKAGNDRLVLIDLNGVPRVFEPVETGLWMPVSYPERLFETLETVDRSGAESLDGFILNTKGGIRIHYNGYGMFTGITELNGNSVEINRNSEQKITNIHGPHANEWSFEYKGNFISHISGPEETNVRYDYDRDSLAWVRDLYGDITHYNYTEGRLEKMIRPDGSSIQITYGYTGAGGALLVSSTTHEEGASERFEYNLSQKLTTYTNHSGVVTRYFYDDKHRTVREDHSDGRVKTFAYNDYDFLESETWNGFEIRYRYDERGNIAEKSYADGSRESWEWSANDQLMRYSDRDGVVTELRYDNNWNITEARRGGQLIYSATYDGGNRLVNSREGGRSELSYDYDSSDFVSGRTINVNGREIREKWKHDAFGRVIKYIDGAGRVWEYEYNAKEIIEMTPLGLHKIYEYDNRKNLVRINEKDTKTGEEREQCFSYDRRRLLLEAIDGAGNVSKYEYRDDGELIRMEQGPWFFEYEYEPSGRMKSLIRGKTDNNKRYIESYDYNWQGWNLERKVARPGAGLTAYSFDPFNRLTGIKNALGENFIRTLNGAGNLLREQSATGGFFIYRYDNLGLPSEIGREGETALRIRYNSDGTIAEKIDRTGIITRYVYDGRGLLIREITPLGEVRYHYDGAGRLVRRDTASRNSVTYSSEWIYNDEQRTVTVREGGIYTEIFYLNAWEEVVKRVDGEGNERAFEYDGAGKLIKYIDGYGRETFYTWNELGMIAAIKYADGTTEYFQYDHQGNPTEIRDEIGIRWSGEYDEAGRLVEESGRPGINREYSYDALDRIVEVKNGGEVTESYSYSNYARELVFSDGTGHDYRQRKNAFGEITGETNRLGDNQNFLYDMEGRAISIESYSGKISRVEYRDAVGITITTFADGNKNLIERDMVGNIVRVVNESGTIRYRYDAGGKLIEQIDEGAGETTRYTYDRAGQRIRMQSGNRDVHYRYGPNGELSRISDQSHRLELSFEYDARGRETRRIYGNGVRQETFYDKIGRIIMIREQDSFNRLLRAEGYLYDNQGRRSHSVDEEGQVTKYEYDGQSRVSSVLYPWTMEKAEMDRKEAERAGLFFTPDKGNGERYTFSAVEQAALREVLNMAGPMRGNAVSSSQMTWRETYGYDRNGNRASKTTPWGEVKYEYDAENRLLKKGDVVYENDKDGNTLSEKGLRYEARYKYNGQNRMVYSEVTSHADRSHTISFYTYDAFGRRTTSGNITGQTLRTIYDGKSFDIIREGESFHDSSLTTRHAPGTAIANATGLMTENLETTERYRWVSDGSSTKLRTTQDGYTVQDSRHGGRGVTLYGNGEPVAANISTNSGTRSMYLGKDLMGSVRSITLSAGTLEDRYEYDAFGQPYKGDFSDGMNLGYTGKPFDTATGLYNYGFRDYRPQAGRFTTIDPIRDGNNWFIYVNNDPVNWIDLWGLCSVEARSRNIPSTMNNASVDSSVLTAAIGMISTGTTVASAGGSLIAAAFTAGSTLGATGAGVAAASGAGLVVVGLAVVAFGIDLIEGNGLDHTKRVIDGIGKK